LVIAAPYSSRARGRYRNFGIVVLVGADAEVDDFSGARFVFGLAAGKVEESDVILEFLQLIERRVPCLDRVEKRLSPVIVAFRLCELDLFVRLGA
jgi:hypothetical protein